MKTNIFRSVILLSAIASFSALFTNVIHAQPLEVHNQFASVVVDITSGQILKIQQYNPANPSLSVDLLCTSSATSHTNFVFGNGSGTPTYYTNNNDNIFFVYDRDPPKAPIKISPRLPDSIYIEGDSIIAEWKFINEGFDIKQYTYPFLTNSSGSIAIEYRAIQTDATTTNYVEGILLEFDTDIQAGIAASCNNVNVGGDNAPILDSHQYEASVNGGCFVPTSFKYTGSDSMPQWFQIANSFNADPSSGSIVFGSLQNPSVVLPGTGPILTPPDEWYIGTWALNQDPAIGLKNVSWVVDTPDFKLGATIGDVALVYKWKVSSNPFRCCTSYGPNDGVNENFNCFNQNFWENMQYPVETIKNPAGVAATPIDTIRLWTTNVSTAGSTQSNVIATLDTTGTCFVLLAGETTTQKVIPSGQIKNNLGPSQTGYCQWLVRSDTSRCCQIGDTTWIEDTINVSVTSTQEPIPFLNPCKPTVAVYCYKCFIDVTPPLITAFGQTPGTYTWTWTTQDDRRCDVGIDSITILDSTNYNVIISPDPFPHCDTNLISINATLIDTTKPGTLSIRILDCNKNADIIPLSYVPGSHLPPVVASTTQSNLETGSSASCTPNYDCTSVVVTENPKQSPSGIDKIIVNSSSNFTLTGLNPTPGVRADTVTACVKDTFHDAQAVFTATNEAGQTMSPPVTVSYCTLQDTLPPVITGGLNGLTFSYTITEKRPWDRGLLDIIVTQNNGNVSVTGPTYYNADSASISFTVIDTALSANFCFLARDSFFVDSVDISQYGGGDSNHMASQCGTFTTGVDTEPPNLWWVSPYPNSSQATIFANDSHYVNGVFYTNDKNLNQVYFKSENDIDISTEPRIVQCSTKSIQWPISVLDTLSLTDTTACFIVAATDCQPNLTVDDTPFCYTITPDIIPPTLAFTHLGVTRDNIYFIAVDSGPYSRGLDSVYLTNLQNIAPLNIGTAGARSINSHGIDTMSFSVHIMDTTQPASACINVMNLWTATHPATMATELTQGCFNTYIAPVWLDTIAVVENGNQFSIPVYINVVSNNEQIKTVDFKIHYPDGIISFNGITGGNGVLPIWNDLGSITGIHTYSIELPTAVALPVGFQPQWSLSFTAANIKDIASSNVWIDSNSVSYNKYQTTTFLANPNALMPNLAPFGAVRNGDTVYVSGQCQQILLQQSGSALTLQQNIPNPFSNVTTINYSLDRTGAMNLTLYNSLGMPVATLVNGVEKPGSYQVSYNASYLRPGVYYYCLNAGGAMLAKTMLIIR